MRLMIILMMLLATGSVFAGECGFGDFFYGGLTINDEDAASGTMIRGIIDNVPEGTYTTTAVGVYGSDSGQDKMYIDCAEDGPVISFQVKVGSTWYDSGETAVCGCGTVHNLDISVDATYDADHDGFGADQGDCDDNDDEIYPGAEDICDGKNNDCDLSVDEDHVADPTACGVGACAAAGELQCVGGVIIDSCTPGAPAVDDVTCDLVDDDCDGTADEDYSVSTTSCGIGACVSAGEMTCVEGTEIDSCQAGAPALNDATCDGIDDDCDATVDEDYVPTTTTCGSGACSASGEMVCDNGQLVDNCLPGDQAAEICNGIDDNCNDEIDEGAEICSANDFTIDQCDYDPDGMDTTKDTFSFVSVCNGELGCSSADTGWETGISHDCVVGECGANCADDSDCADSSCPVDRCYDGVYRDYDEGVANTCVECMCSSNQCTYTTPYDSEVCDGSGDGIDNDCDGQIDERCKSDGDACTDDYQCGFDSECTDNVCVAKSVTCDIFYPLDLADGWNLIGFPSCTAMPIAQGLESIEGQYSDVFSLVDGVWLSYNPQSAPELNTLDTLNPFQGIYIKMNGAGTLLV